MSVQNFSFLARLEVAEKFVVGWWWGGVGWWSRPSLGFSFSQAEQNSIDLDILISQTEDKSNMEAKRNKGLKHPCT